MQLALSYIYYSSPAIYEIIANEMKTNLKWAQEAFYETNVNQDSGSVTATASESRIGSK